MPKTWFFLIWFWINICHGTTINDEDSNATQRITNEDITAATASIVPAIDIQSMDDALLGTKPPTLEQVTFIDVPRNTETELGSSVLLTCRTSHPVFECQWSWQPLTPQNFPLPDISDHVTNTSTILNVTSTTGPTSHPSPIHQFRAFGNNSNDCSVRFPKTKYEECGYWTCAARISSDQAFTSTEPAKLSISSKNQEQSFGFVKHETALEVPVESPAQIKCQTTTPVKECLWYWRQLNESKFSNHEIKRFSAFGNNSTDCSIKLVDILPKQEGYWTCAARVGPNSSFQESEEIRLMISTVEFVQLSRDVQIAAGESAFLRCLVNKPIAECEWSWRATYDSKKLMIMKKFTPNKESDHDCSVRFKNLLYEEEGLWTCGVRLISNGILHQAAPTTVSLLPSAKVNFVEIPKDVTVVINGPVTLPCVTGSRVEKCTWFFKTLQGGNETETIAREFPSQGDLGRNCTLYLSHVGVKEQGQWSCQISITSLNTVLSSPYAKVSISEQDNVEFSELSQDIQISSGGSVLLRCVTSRAVEQCRWSLTPVNSNTTVVVKQFKVAGNEARDCSVRLSHALAEQEGLWTCGVQVRGQMDYMDAPPAKLTLLEPEPVTVALWATPHQMITLACRVGPVPKEVQCYWNHEPSIYLRQNNASTAEKRSRYNVQMDYSRGICTLEFKPNQGDLGEWTCKLILGNGSLNKELGSASLILLNTITDQKLGWIVGGLTIVILFLMITVVVLVVYKTRFFERDQSDSPPKKFDDTSFCNEGYTENPTKLDTQPPEQIQQPRPSVTSISKVLPNRSPHFYERVRKSNTTTKFYENVRV